MKRARALLFMVALAALTHATHGQGWITNGLVAYYPFNGNANDESGNGNHGTPIEIVYGTDRYGQTSRTAVFNGASSTIPINGLTGGNFMPVTVSIWAKGMPTYGSDTGFFCKYAVASANGFGIFAFGDHVHSWYFGSQGNVYALETVKTLDGQWHHIVATYNSDGGVIYVDGVVVDTGTWSGSPSSATSPEPILIGEYRSSNGSDSRKFTGSLDDIRIYNRALSAQEVAQLYAMESFCSPHRAQALATIAGDGVAGATMSDLGCGYTNTPGVRIIGGGGSGATAIANMINGIVTDLIITSGGSGYTNAPRILIESPPFVPTVGIAVSRVNVTQRVRVNHNYVLESSTNLIHWTPTGPPFTAESEEITNEFVVIQTGQYFRLREVP